MSRPYRVQKTRCVIVQRLHRKGFISLTVLTNAKKHSSKKKVRKTITELNNSTHKSICTTSNLQSLPRRWHCQNLLSPANGRLPTCIRVCQGSMRTVLKILVCDPPRSGLLRVLRFPLARLRHGAIRRWLAANAQCSARRPCPPHRKYRTLFPHHGRPTQRQGRQEGCAELHRAFWCNQSGLGAGIA